MILTVVDNRSVVVVTDVQNAYGRCNNDYVHKLNISTAKTIIYRVGPDRQHRPV